MTPQAATTLPLGLSAPSIADWLLSEARQLADSRAVVSEFGKRLCAEGFPVFRLFVSLRTLHPQVLAIGLAWRRGAQEATEVPRAHNILESPQYLNSPIRLIFEGAPMVRRRIGAGEGALDFPILAELKVEGVTDYLALPLSFSHGRMNVISIATDRSGGFSSEDIDRFAELMPLLSLVLEVKETGRIANTLLETYLGRDAGRRVLSGLVKRGDGATIAAALWYCDLRGFTRMSEAMPRDEVIETLNDWFSAVAEPVHAHGGEVLKFIGDAMLAIFPIADDLDRDRACHTALTAAEAALAGLDQLNEGRAEAGKPPLEMGLALHMGAVMYGNIGAPDRLDFTVIGPAVNLVTRLEGLTARLGLRLVASTRFASPCGSRLRSIGRHELRGIAEPEEVFSLPGLAQETV
jgi:adenylate cyclase